MGKTTICGQCGIFGYNMEDFPAIPDLSFCCKDCFEKYVDAYLDKEFAGIPKYSIGDEFLTKHDILAKISFVSKDGLQFIAETDDYIWKYEIDLDDDDYTPVCTATVNKARINAMIDKIKK